MINEDGTCTQVMCNNQATMTLDLTVPLHNGDMYEQSVPYCDEDLGWFYRSFMRKSYNVKVRGITILKDLDEEFGRS